MYSAYHHVHVPIRVEFFCTTVFSAPSCTGICLLHFSVCLYRKLFCCKFFVSKCTCSIATLICVILYMYCNFLASPYMWRPLGHLCHIFTAHAQKSLPVFLSVHSKFRFYHWIWWHTGHKIQPGIEWVQVLADISRSALCCHSIATKPVHRLQIRPIVHNYRASPTIPPLYIRFHAVVWQCGEGQTDTQTAVTNIQFVSAAPVFRNRLKTHLFSRSFPS